MPIRVPVVLSRDEVKKIRSVRQPDAVEARRAVGSVERLRSLQLRAQLVSTGVCPERRPVFVALAAAHEDEALVEIDSLDPQLAAFRHAQAAAIDQRGHQPRRATHGPEQRGGLRQTQDDRQMLSTFWPAS